MVLSESDDEVVVTVGREDNKCRVFAARMLAMRERVVPVSVSCLCCPFQDAGDEDADSNALDIEAESDRLALQEALSSPEEVQEGVMKQLVLNFLTEQARGGRESGTFGARRV